MVVLSVGPFISAVYNRCMKEQTLNSKIIYSGKVVQLRVETVEGPKGRSVREIVDHANAVTIIPFEAPNKVWLIHQYRKAVDTVLIESPAGCMEDRESPLLAASRELAEETGFRAEHLHAVGEMYMAPGFCNEYMHYFIATGLTKGATNMDVDECIELVPYTLEEVDAMIANHTIIDAKTIMGISFLHTFLARES
mgnify:CR=1 FL=1